MAMTLTIESFATIKKGMDNGITMEQVIKQIELKSYGRPLINMIDEFYRSLEDAEDNN